MGARLENHCAIVTVFNFEVHCKRDDSLNYQVAGPRYILDEVAHGCHYRHGAIDTRISGGGPSRRLGSGPGPGGEALAQPGDRARASAVTAPLQHRSSVTRHS